MSTVPLAGFARPASRVGAARRADGRLLRPWVAARPARPLRWKGELSRPRLGPGGRLRSITRPVGIVWTITGWRMRKYRSNGFTMPELTADSAASARSARDLRATDRKQGSRFTHRGWGQHNCSLREAVGVRCTAQGVLLNVSSLTVVEESTTGAGYTVRLGRVPTGNVTVTPVAPSGSDLSFSPTSLTFSTQDYNLAKTVTVTAAGTRTRPTTRTR